MQPTTLRLDRLETRVTPAVAMWDGDGADNHWTTAANWAGNIGPRPDDDLVFPSAAAQLVNVNDFPAGMVFHSLAVNGMGYQLTGNRISLTAGLSANVPSVGIPENPLTPPVIGLPLTVTAGLTFSDVAGSVTLSGSVDVNDHGLGVVTEGAATITTISGSITGFGGLGLAGSGAILLSGASTFSGFTTVRATVDVQGTLPSPTVVEPSGTLSGSGTVGDVSNYGRLTPGGWLVSPPTAATLKTRNLSIGRSAQTSFVILGPGSSTGLAVTGGVEVGGLLNLSSLPGVQGLGKQYTLIDNDGTDQVVGAFLNAPEGALVNARGTLFRITYHGGDGNDVVATAAPPLAYAVGAGRGGVPIVKVYAANGELIRSFFAYATSFDGGVRVATADVTGDGVPDIITAPGPGGGPHVRVFDGVTFAVVREFMAYDPAFTGGVFIAASQIDHDNQAEIITGAGAGGGPHVKVFDGKTGATLSSFFAYDAAFRGGVSVAGTDSYFTFIGSCEGSVITGAGPGGGPHVRVFDGTTGALTREFFAYDPAFRGGVNVASQGPLYDLVGNAPLGGANPSPIVTWDLTAGAIVTAPASNDAPDVRLFGPTGQQIAEFQAYDPSFRGGVTVAVTGSNSGAALVETGAGPHGGPHVKLWQIAGNVATEQQSFFAFDPAFLGGVFVGSGAGPSLQVISPPP
jgi:hypothetical protein